MQCLTIRAEVIDETLNITIDNLAREDSTPVEKDVITTFETMLRNFIKSQKGLISYKEIGEIKWK